MPWRSNTGSRHWNVSSLTEGTSPYRREPEVVKLHRAEQGQLTDTVLLAKRLNLVVGDGDGTHLPSLYIKVSSLVGSNKASCFGLASTFISFGLAALLLTVWRRCSILALPDDSLLYNPLAPLF